MCRRCGGIGRRKGLKIPRSNIRAGSSPASGTKSDEVEHYCSSNGQVGSTLSFFYGKTKLNMNKQIFFFRLGSCSIGFRKSKRGKILLKSFQGKTNETPGRFKPTRRFFAFLDFFKNIPTQFFSFRFAFPLTFARPPPKNLLFIPYAFCPTPKGENKIL